MIKAQTVGERIAQARREKGVRDRADVRPVDVARALEVSGATVSDWEAGKVIPREELLAKLAEFLGVTPAYLRYGVGAERKDALAALIDPANDRRLTDEEIQRARDQVAAQRAATTAPRKRGGRKA